MKYNGYVQFNSTTGYKHHCKGSPLQNHIPKFIGNSLERILTYNI